MKNNRVLIKPTNASELRYQLWFENISNEWEVRAEKLRIRRWRKLKNEIKGKKFTNSQK